MNKLIHSMLIAAVVLAAQAVTARDSKEHEKEAAAKNASPDCAQMKNMDMSKMGKSDPAMKAMHEKCMDQMGREGMGQPHGPSNKSADEKAPAAPGKHEGH